MAHIFHAYSRDTQHDYILSNFNGLYKCHKLPKLIILDINEIYGHHKYDFGYNHVGYSWNKHGKCEPPVKTIGKYLYYIKSYAQKNFKKKGVFWPIFSVK